jgi:hypothetical protein
VAAERKISDEELARLRGLHDDGWSLQNLGAAFGITPQHAGRLVRGEQRPVLAGPEPERMQGDVSVAVKELLSGADLDPGDNVLAATARVLAGKLDGCSGSESATAAQAAPRLAAQLVDVLERLREAVPREPDALDFLRQRRTARRHAVTNGKDNVL